MTKKADPNIIRSLASDPKRRSKEIADIQFLLDAQTRGQGQIARLEWLFDLVQDYLYRWSGGIRFFSMEDFLRNDLHTALIIGVDLVDEETTHLLGCDTFKDAWQAFSLIVRSINKQTSKDIGGELQAKFDAAKQNLLLEPEKGSGVVSDIL